MTPNLPSMLSLNEKPVLDLRFHHFQHVHAGIAVIGTWYMDPDTRQSEPCLVLLDRARLRGKSRRPIPCIVRLNDMWMWATDPDRVADQIEEWMTSGALPGDPHNRKDVFRILDAVNSRLRDLWSMPPLPPKAAIKNGAVPVGDLTIIERESGKTIQQIEMVAANVRH